MNYHHHNQYHQLDILNRDLDISANLEHHVPNFQIVDKTKVPIFIGIHGLDLEQSNHMLIFMELPLAQAHTLIWLTNAPQILETEVFCSRNLNSPIKFEHIHELGASSQSSNSLPLGTFDGGISMALFCGRGEQWQSGTHKQRLITTEWIRKLDRKFPKFSLWLVSVFLYCQAAYLSRSGNAIILCLYHGKSPKKLKNIQRLAVTKVNIRREENPELKSWSTGSSRTSSGKECDTFPALILQGQEKVQPFPIRKNLIVKQKGRLDQVQFPNFVRI